MAEAERLASLILYRKLRAGHPPEEAVELLRDHVRIAREYAIAASRWAHAAELRDEEGHLTAWLQEVRRRACRTGRHGTYWHTGKFKGPLRFTVRPTGDNEGGFIPRVCESAGCAIKHALFALQLSGVYEVLITDTWTNNVRLIDRATTMAQLNAMSWPVD